MTPIRPFRFLRVGSWSWRERPTAPLKQFLFQIASEWEGKKQLALELDTPAAKRFRNVFGYVAFIKPADSRGAASPFCAQVVVKLPYKFGSSHWEEKVSFIYVRLNAFASRACLGGTYQPLCMGSVVRGLIEKADSDYDTAQLVSWSCASAAEKV